MKILNIAWLKYSVFSFNRYNHRSNYAEHRA